MGRGNAMTITIFLAAIASGCSANDAADGGGVDLNALNPAMPGRDYVAENDPAAQAQLIDEMLAVLVAPNCWDASAAAPVANVSQFTFTSQGGFRHFGFTINFGTVFLHSVGHYQGRMAAIVETWTGVVEAIVILDSSTFAHVFPNPANTALVVTRYGSSTGPCL